MKATTLLPPNFSKRTILEPSRDPKFVIGATVTGIALLLLSVWLLVLFTNALRPDALDGLRLRDLIRSTPTGSSLAIPPALFSNLFIALVAMLITHELVHGLFYWLLSKKHPKMGIQGLLPYTAAPAGVYFPRNQFLTIGLAPLASLSVVGLLLIAVAPLPIVPFIVFFVAFNAAGAAGDLIMAIQLLSFSADTLIEDNDAGLTIYGLPGNQNAA